jgi:hypothetical protein
MTCQFTELSVSKQIQPIAVTTVSAPPLPTPEHCAFVQRSVDEDAAAGNVTTPDKAQRTQPPGGEAEGRKAVLESCSTGKPDAWRRWIALSRERSLKTCDYAAHSYMQTFHRVSEQLGEVQWATDGDPQGLCGVVNQSRFISTKVPGGGNTPFWIYVSDYKVLHRSAKDYGRSCSGAAPDRHWTFTWCQDEALAEVACETVRFTNIGCLSRDFPCLTDATLKPIH